MGAGVQLGQARCFQADDGIQDAGHPVDNLHRGDHRRYGQGMVGCPPAMPPTAHEWQRGSVMWCGVAQESALAALPVLCGTKRGATAGRRSRSSSPCSPLARTLPRTSGLDGVDRVQPSRPQRTSTSCEICAGRRGAGQLGRREKLCSSLLTWGCSAQVLGP